MGLGMKVALLPCLRAVFHGVARHGQGGDVAEGINDGGVRIGDEDHVALFHHGIAIVEASKPMALFMVSSEKFSAGMVT